jgi:membrane protease YdiL (CAAX protease family)
VPTFFVIVGVFYSLIHSGLEEYYWRWFLYRRLTKTMRWNHAAVLSSCGFMLHHVLILGTYFGFTHWVTWLGSIGCAVGGLYWCWSYKRFDNVYPLWISHGIIDAAIFVVGYLAIFNG